MMIDINDTKEYFTVAAYDHSFIDRTRRTSPTPNPISKSLLFREGAGCKAAGWFAFARGIVYAAAPPRCDHERCPAKTGNSAAADGKQPLKLFLVRKPAGPTESAQ